MSSAVFRHRVDALAARALGVAGRRQAAVRSVVVVGVLVAAWVLGQSPSRLVVAALAIGTALAILLRFRSLALPGLLLAIAFVPITIGTGTESSVNVAMLGVAALGGLWIVDTLLEDEERTYRSGTGAAWIALIAAGAIGFVAGAAHWNPFVLVKSNFFMVQSAQLAIYVLSAVAFYSAAHFATSLRDLRSVTMIAIGIGFVIGFGSILPGLGLVGSRLLLFSVNIRVWSAALALAIALFDNRLDKRLRVALAIGPILAIVVSATGGGSWLSGWLPPAVAVVTLILLRLGSASYRLAFVVSPLIPIAAIALIRRLIEAEAWSFDTRMIAWRGLFDLVGDRWLFGLGLASYGHYWRDVIGSFSYLDPATGYLHSTNDPKVNMHNNYLDVYGQMGVVGVLAFAWLLIALVLLAWRVFRAQDAGFGKAYAAAALSALVAMGFASMLGDWLFPFVYNIGLTGFRDSSVTFLLLGGLMSLDRGQVEPAPVEG